MQTLLEEHLASSSPFPGPLIIQSVNCLRNVMECQPFPPTATPSPVTMTAVQLLHPTLAPNLTASEEVGLSAPLVPGFW